MRLEKIRYPNSKAPKLAQVLEITDGIFWAQMSLPLLIDHVNVYIFEEKNSLTLIDTGLNVPMCRSAWSEILKVKFKNKPVKKIIITHHHPDHIGLLGWFAETTDLEILISRTSWLLARMLFFEKQEKPSKEALLFWRKAGMDKKTFESKRAQRPFNFADGVMYFPLGFTALSQGDEIVVGKKKWRVELGQGHAPDHVTLWGLDCPLVFSGDQVIPGISSNLGVYPTEPLLDTVGLWLDTCNRFLKIAEDNHYVLPGHKLPFYGLASRLKQLIENHVQALDRIEKKLSMYECTAVDLFDTIFKRPISKSEYGLALAEAVGHINYFRARNYLKCVIRDDGAILYSLK